jgi:glycosyltransferase involved in cell wall biosynthesis
MRILKTTQTYYPYLSKGGPPAKVRAIAKQLAQRGHEVTVLTAVHHPGSVGISPANAFQARPNRFGFESHDAGVETVYLRTVRNYRATTINPQVLNFCTNRLSDYDVVHIYGLYDLIGSVSAWFCRRRGIPYVLEPLGMFGPKIRSQKKKQLYNKLVGDALFERARVVIATSETERNELISGGVDVEKIVLRRNGIDQSEFAKLPERGELRKRLGLDDATTLLVFLGRISFIKGLDLLMQAVALLPQTAPNVHLLIAGPDDEDGCAAKIAELGNRLQLRDRVTISGPIYGDQRLQAFVDADFLVLPSRYESFGNVAGEAIACGTPVLVTNECGIANLVEGRAGLSVPATIGGLAEGIQRLTADTDFRARLRANCADVARGLAWDEPVEEMERLYRSLVSEAREETSNHYRTPTCRGGAGC